MSSFCYNSGDCYKNITKRQPHIYTGFKISKKCPIYNKKASKKVDFYAKIRYNVSSRSVCKYENLTFFYYINAKKDKIYFNNIRGDML